MTTKNTQAGRRIEWTEDGKTYGGAIVSEEVKHHAGLDMDLTHVRIKWDDGTADTQHTLESLVKDPRVRLPKQSPKSATAG